MINPKSNENFRKSTIYMRFRFFKLERITLDDYDYYADWKFFLNEILCIHK